MESIDLTDIAQVQQYLQELQESMDLTQIQIFLAEVPPHFNAVSQMITFIHALRAAYAEPDFKRQQFEQAFTQRVKQNVSFFFAVAALTAGSSNFHKFTRDSALDMLRDAEFSDIIQLEGYLKSKEASPALISRLFSVVSKQAVQQFLETFDSLPFDVLQAICGSDNRPDLTSFRNHENVALRRLAALKLENDEELLTDPHYMVRSAACSVCTNVGLLVQRMTDKSVIVRKSALQRLSVLISEDYDGEEHETEQLTRNCLVILSQSDKSDFLACLELTRLVIMHKIGRFQLLLQAVICLLASAAKTPYLGATVKQKLSEFLLQFVNHEIYNFIELYLVQPNTSTVDVVVEQLLAGTAVSEGDLTQLLNLIISEHDQYYFAARILKIAAKIKPATFMHKRIQQNMLTKLAELIQAQKPNIALVELLADTMFYVLFGDYCVAGELQPNEIFDQFSNAVLYACDAVVDLPFKSLIRLFCLNNKARVDQLFGMLVRRAEKLYQQLNYVQFCAVLAIFLSDAQQFQAQLRAEAAQTRVAQIAACSGFQFQDATVFQEYSYIINACFAGLSIFRHLSGVAVSHSTETVLTQVFASLCAFLGAFPPGLLVQNEDLQPRVVQDLREGVRALPCDNMPDFCSQAIKYYAALILKSPSEFGFLFDEILYIQAATCNLTAVQQQFVFSVSSLVFSNSIKLGAHCERLVALAFSQNDRIRVYTVTVLRQLGAIGALQPQFHAIAMQIIQHLGSDDPDKARATAREIVSFCATDKYRPKMLDIVAHLDADADRKTEIAEWISAEAKPQEEDQT